MSDPEPAKVEPPVSKEETPTKSKPKTKAPPKVKETKYTRKLKKELANPETPATRKTWIKNRLPLEYRMELLRKPLLAMYNRPDFPDLFESQGTKEQVAKHLKVPLTDELGLKAISLMWHRLYDEKKVNTVAFWRSPLTVEPKKTLFSE